jgi:hypothetical protein
MVHRHREERARRQAAAEEAEHVAERVEQPSYKAVKTAQQSPEVFNAISYNIAAGAYTRILPLSPYRSRAVILLASPITSCILAKDDGAALGGVGFTLPSNVPIVVTARGQLFAYNNTGATIIVSVITELYAPEK